MQCNFLQEQGKIQIPFEWSYEKKVAKSYRKINICGSYTWWFMQCTFYSKWYYNRILHLNWRRATINSRLWRHQYFAILRCRDQTHRYIAVRLSYMSVQWKTPKVGKPISYHRSLNVDMPHTVCLSCSAESATEAIFLALSCTERVFHIALRVGSIPTLHLKTFEQLFWITTWRKNSRKA